MGGVRYITQKALHGMSAQRTVSIQEAVHMVDNQDLVICSEKFTYLSIRQGAMLTSNKDNKKKKRHCNYVQELQQTVRTHFHG